MSLGRPCRCSMRFKKLHFAPRGKNIFFKNNISLTWHSLISLFCYYPPLKEEVTLHFNIFESPLHKDILCQIWLKLVKWFLRRRFLNASMYFLYVTFISLVKILISLYPRILCVMFGWNWPSGSGIDFQKLSIYFLKFLLLSPLRKRARSFIWKKLNPLNPRMFCAKFG